MSSLIGGTGVASDSRDSFGLTIPSRMAATQSIFPFLFRGRGDKATRLSSSVIVSSNELGRGVPCKQAMARIKKRKGERNLTENLKEFSPSIALRVSRKHPYRCSLSTWPRGCHDQKSMLGPRRSVRHQPGGEEQALSRYHPLTA